MIKIDFSKILFDVIKFSYMPTFFTPCVMTFTVKTVIISHQ